MLNADALGHITFFGNPNRQVDQFWASTSERPSQPPASPAPADAHLRLSANWPQRAVLHGRRSGCQGQSLKGLKGSLNRIVELLARYGQNAVAYHSHLSEPHRRDNLRLFRRGMVNVLVTCRALDEGTNVPEANVAVVARSTSSTRQRIQRLGRVLRPAANKIAATVYTLFTGEDERDRLAEEEQELEGVARIIWKRGVLK